MKKATNSWEVLLNNLLPETIVVPLLSNLAKFNQEDLQFQLYPDGISASVVNILQEVDEDRQKICRALGIEAKSLERRLVETGYAKPLDELIDQLKESDVLKKKAIVPIEANKQLLEGLHFGVVPWGGRSHYARTRNTNAQCICCHLGSVSLDRLLVQEGLTLDKIGLFNETAYTLTTAVQEIEEADEPLSLQ